MNDEPRNLYVAYCNDRHYDPVIRVFTTPEAAVSFCRDFVESHAREDSEITEEDPEQTASNGWLVSLSYGTEGDHAYAFETTLDDGGKI
jgi:hypothetical protein